MRTNRKISRIRWMLAVLVGVAAFLPTRSSSAAGDLATGEHVFARYCQTCHGVRGDGRGPSAFRLEGPPPRDFTRGI